MTTKNNTAEKKETVTEKSPYKNWAKGYEELQKTWLDSYQALYGPWVDVMKDLSLEMEEMAKGNVTPKVYKKFYDRWVETYTKTFGKLPEPIMPTTDILEHMQKGAKDSTELYNSWIQELEKISKDTSNVLKGEADPLAFKELYGRWTKTYYKIYKDSLGLPAMEPMREVLKHFTGMPDLYSETFKGFSNMWIDSYMKLYTPWMEAITEMSAKVEEISRKTSGPEAYKEFYDLWTNTYKETLEKFPEMPSIIPTKEQLQNFSENFNGYLKLYKSWIETLETMSEKTDEIVKTGKDPKEYKKFFDLWVKTYETAFDNFFATLPMLGPMKEMFGPVKKTSKMYSDTYLNFSKMWTNSYLTLYKKGEPAE
ncbi:hypothetical protein KKA03_03160 [archaeon]|nr:hypothetical protein [archaeon]